MSDCYLPLGYITEAEIGTYLHSADYYLGRSGAHICYELSVVGLPSLLVPLLSTHDHEQHKNALFLVKAQLGLILSESNLSYPHFLEAIQELQALVPTPPHLPLHASASLVDDLLAELK